MADERRDFIPHHFQTQSPLFGVLSGEIRNEIFALALVPYEDDEAAYPEDSYWYRPGFTGPKKSSSALLRTCKLAYQEGRKVFLSEIECAFWFTVQNLQRVRLFTQLFWLENGFGLQSVFRHPRFRPSTVTITIRYSDWWYWETNTPLKMKEDWLRRFKGPPGLRELRVEYETLSWKKAEMMQIVERNKEWELGVRDDEKGCLSAKGTKLIEWRWKGPSKLNGQNWAHHGPGETVEYVVISDTWRYVTVKEEVHTPKSQGNAMAFSDDESSEDDFLEIKMRRI